MHCIYNCNVFGVNNMNFSFGIMHSAYPFRCPSRWRKGKRKNIQDLLRLWPLPRIRLENHKDWQDDARLTVEQKGASSNFLPHCQTEAIPCVDMTWANLFIRQSWLKTSECSLKHTVRDEFEMLCFSWAVF